MKTLRQLLILVISINISTHADAQNLQNSIDQIKQNHDLMGGVAVVFCKDQIIESVPFGLADYQRNIMVNDSTVFRIASVSKVITAIAIMQLIDAELLQAETIIDSVLGFSVKNPSYPDDSITIQMLLSHTSGIVDGNAYNNFLNATYNNNPIPQLSELLTPGGSYYAGNIFQNTPPGQYFTYSNLNYGILGTVVEKISGQRFDVYCRQHILMPLGIDGSFNVNDIQDINNVAVLYRKTSGSWVPQADNYQGVQPVFGNLSGYIPGTNGLRFAPQGGLRISGEDLAKIFMALLNNGSYMGYQLISKNALDMMLQSSWQYNGSNGDNYYGLFRSWGMGIHIITNTPDNDIVLSGSQIMFGHPGEAYGLVSDAYIDTLRKTGLIFFTNGCGNGYTVGNGSAFYTLEKDVFDAIEQHSDLAYCATSEVLEHTKNLQLSIFPVPCDQTLHIELPQYSSEKIEIINQMGQDVTFTFCNSNSCSIYTGNLPCGIYILRLDERFIKFVVSHP